MTKGNGCAYGLALWITAKISHELIDLDSGMTLMVVKLHGHLFLQHTTFSYVPQRFHSQAFGSAEFSLVQVGTER